MLRGRGIALAIVCALGLVGCGTLGRLQDSAFPRLEASPIANLSPYNKGRPRASGGGSAPQNARLLREMQVELNALLADELRLHGFTIGSVGADQPMTQKRIHLSTDAPTQYSQLMAAIGMAPEADRIDMRNEVAAQLTAASDANCEIYSAGLRTGQVSSRLLFDTLASGSATYATLASSQHAARVLSALSALFIASESSIDRNVFASQAAEPIADAIRIARDQRRPLMVAKRTQAYDQWRTADAIGEILDFHADCTVERGLMHVQNAVSGREQAIQAIRLAALNVAKAHGTPDQVVAVIGGLDVNAATITPLGAGTPSAPSSISWEADLDKANTQALDCLDHVRSVMINPDGGTPKTVAAAVVLAEAVHGDEVCKLAGSNLPGPAGAATPDCSAAAWDYQPRCLVRLLLTTAGTAGTDLANAANEDFSVGDANGTVDDHRIQDLVANFGALRDLGGAQLKARTRVIVARRTAAFDDAADQSSKLADPAAVAKNIATIGGADSTADPAFKSAASTLAALPTNSPNASAKIAATMARDAAKSYVANSDFAEPTAKSYEIKPSAKK